MSDNTSVSFAVAVQIRYVTPVEVDQECRGYGYGGSLLIQILGPPDPRNTNEVAK